MNRLAMVSYSINRLSLVLVTRYYGMFQYIIIIPLEERQGFDPLTLPDEFNPSSDFTYDEMHYDKCF